MSNPNDPTVFVVDDDDAMRDSTRFLLDSAGLSVETFPSAEDFLDVFEADRRGCVLLDVRMPGMGGMRLHEKLIADKIGIPVILITGHADVPMAVKAMRNGVFDFIEKPCDDEHLVNRIRDAIRHDAEQRVDDQILAQVHTCLTELSPREREVMELVVAGFLNKQIAEMMSVSIKTVEVHRSRVMSKMRAATLPDLVRMAMLAGID